MSSSSSSSIAEAILNEPIIGPHKVEPLNLVAESQVIFIMSMFFDHLMHFYLLTALRVWHSWFTHHEFATGRLWKLLTVTVFVAIYMQVCVCYLVDLQVTKFYSWMQEKYFYVWSCNELKFFCFNTTFCVVWDENCAYSYTGSDVCWGSFILWHAGKAGLHLLYQLCNM